MKVNRTIIFALCVIAAVLAGCNKAATAQENKGGKQVDETQSVEFYLKNFSKRLLAEAECRKNPELASTQKCINARKAANAVSRELGMPLEYPEAEDNGQ